MRNLELKNSGQSLVEVVVGIGLVTTVLVALVSAMNTGLGNAQFTRNKSKATGYAQEALEWVRSQRDAQSWTTFVNAASTTSSPPCGNTTYCLKNVGVGTSFPSAGACGAGDTIPPIYTRDATLVRQSDDQVRVDVTVTWPEGNRTSQVASSTQLSNWRPTSVASPALCAPTPTPPPSPSPLPSASPQIVIIEGEDISCTTKCTSLGLTCANIGTNSGRANNGRYWTYDDSGLGQCRIKYGNCSQTLPNTGICTGHTSDWTYCNCQ